MYLSITFEIVSLLSARCFKFMIKSGNFFRIFLSSYLLKLLRETSLEITKTLMSAFFEHIFFSPNLNNLYKIGEEILYWFNFWKQPLTLRMSVSWNIFCWLGYIIMKIFFNHGLMLITWCFKYVKNHNNFPDHGQLKLGFILKIRNVDLKKIGL